MNEIHLSQLTDINNSNIPQNEMGDIDKILGDIEIINNLDANNITDPLLATHMQYIKDIDRQKISPISDEDIISNNELNNLIEDLSKSEGFALMNPESTNKNSKKRNVRSKTENVVQILDDVDELDNVFKHQQNSDDNSFCDVTELENIELDDSGFIDIETYNLEEV